MSKSISETEENSWDLDSDDINANNINPVIPKELWDNLLWRALRVAIETSETMEEVLRKTKLWNRHNNPQLSEVDLIQKCLWALQKWDTKFKGL